MKKLYELPENQNIKLYFDDDIDNKKGIVVIFGHLDGLYSYCWLEEDKNKIVHIKATTLFKKYKDGYKYVESKRRISMSEEEMGLKIKLDDSVLKNEILNKMFLNLSQESLLDILEILKGYAERVHKSKKDTTLARCMFAYGYHNTLEFQNLLGLTKDNTEIKALSNNVYSIKTLNKLRQSFNIDDNTFVKIIKEIDTDLESEVN